MRPDGPRDPVAGPDTGPEDPFPLKLSGPVIKGFGRGSKEVSRGSLLSSCRRIHAVPGVVTGFSRFMHLPAFVYLARRACSHPIHPRTQHSLPKSHHLQDAYHRGSGLDS